MSGFYFLLTDTLQTHFSNVDSDWLHCMGVRNIARALDFWSKALHYTLKGPIEKDWAILIPKRVHGIQFSLKRTGSQNQKDTL